MKFIETVFKENYKKQYKTYIVLLSTICLIESILLIRGVMLFNFSKIRHSLYLVSYLILLTMSIVYLLYIFKYSNSIDKNFKKLYIVNLCYCILFIIWGGFVSFDDALSGVPPFVYVTVLICVSAFFIIPKVIFTSVSAAVLVVFMVLLSILSYDNFSEIFKSGSLINILILYGSSIFIVFKVDYIRKIQYIQDKELSKRIIVDPLTGAYNRRQLDLKVNEQIENNKFFKYIILDIDNFKDINDQYGHTIGDEVLKIVVNVLKKYFNDEVYRIGGDEFVILCDEETYDIDDRFDNVRKDLSKTKYNVTVSFGVYSSNAEDNIINIYQCADKALYEAKERGKNQGCYY